jgi:hypothetical protein
MGWMEFVSNMTGSLAWPLAAIVIVCIFRKGIIARIPGLSELTLPGGIAAKFKDGLPLVENGVNEAAATKIEPAPGSISFTGPPPTVEQTTNSPSKIQASVGVIEEPDVIEMAGYVGEQKPYVLYVRQPIAEYEVDPIALRANPTGVVMESWKSIESAIQELAKTALPKNVTLNIRNSYKSLFKFLLTKHAITDVENETLLRMYELRNMDAHTDQRISAGDAKRFQEAAETLVRTLRKKAWSLRPQTEVETAADCAPIP